jgi:hypothetical protein
MELRIVVGVNHLRTKALSVIVLVDALIMAYGHVPLIRAIYSPFFSFFFALGAYLLFATVVYILGGIFVVAGKLFKLSTVGLIIMTAVDNVLLVYTRSVPNIFFRRPIPWSGEWLPLGTVQILFGQAIIIVLCAILLYKPRLQEAQQSSLSKHS